MRAYSGLPLNPSQSDLFTDTARTSIRTSSSLGVGLATSLSPSTPGGPYFVYTIAFTLIPPQQPVPPAQRRLGVRSVGGASLVLLSPRSCGECSSLHSDATRGLARLLGPFVVELDVYAFDHEPEEKRQLPNDRGCANNRGQCLRVVG